MPDNKRGDRLRDIQLSEDEAEFAILDYSISHKEMVIKVSTPEQPHGIYFLKFEAVMYFQGPTKWIGGELRLGTPDEVDEIIKRIHHPIMVGTNLHELRDSHRLFIISSQKDEIKILAGKSAERLYERPWRPWDGWHDGRRFPKAPGE